MTQRQRCMAIAALTFVATFFVPVVGVGWALYGWYAGLIALAWRELPHRPGERFRDFVLRMCWPDKFYDAMFPDRK